jgi:uncharacterized protein YggE
MKRSFILSFATLAAVAVFGVSRIPVQAQDVTAQPPQPTVQSDSHTITVSGSGTASGAPDTAYLDLGVQITDADLGKAFNSVADSIAKVTKALTDAGIKPEDIRTTGLNVYPQDQYDQQTGATTGRTYQVANTVTVTIRDLTKLEDVITASVNAGANTVSGLSFGIADQTKLEDQAREAAVKDARQRADKLAAALGVSVGDPVVVVEVNGSVVQPMPMLRMAANTAGAQAASMPVSQGQLDVTVNVQISFAIAK